MTDLLLKIAILVWPFGQLLQLTSPGTGFRLQLLDVVSLLLTLSLLTYHEQVTKDRLFKPLILVITAFTLSLLISGNTSPIAISYLLRFASYCSFYFALRLQGVNKFLPYLLLSGSLFFGLGFFQYLIFPDVRILRIIGFDDHYYRLVGTFLDPNFTGLVLSVFTLLLISAKQLRLKWLFIIPLAALVLTFSRASFLSLITGLIFLGITKKQYKILLSILILGLVIIVAPKPFGEGVNLLRTFSITSRLDNQLTGITLFLKNPIFGVGFNTLKSSITSVIPNLSSGIDNSYIFVLVTSGLIGFIAFLNLLIKSWQYSASLTIRACLVAIFIHSLFNNSLFYSWILPVFFLLISVKGTKEKISP